MTIDFELLKQTLAPALEAARIEPDVIPIQTVSTHEPEDPVFECDEQGNPIDPSPGLPEIVDSSEFVAGEMPTPPELIIKLAHQGTKMIMGGGSKSFKTWIQMDCAISIAYGLEWMGFQCNPGRVLFTNLEIPAAFFQKRLHKIFEARGIKPEPGRLDVWNLRGFSAPYRIILPQISQRMKAIDRGYVANFLDPIYKLYGNTDENSASEVAQLLNAIERICVDHNVLNAFGAHYSKGNQSAKEAIDRISGSGTFARDPDSIINFTQHSEENCFVVEPILRNLAPVAPFVVRWNFPLMERDDDLDPSKLKQSAGRPKSYVATDFLKHIAQNTKTNPISISDWADLAGVPRRTLADYVPELRNKGYISTFGEGRHARQYITPDGVDFLSGGN